MIVKGESDMWTSVSEHQSSKIHAGLTIVGNSAGTAKEMDELMEMAVAGDVTAHIECFDFNSIEDVLQRLGRSEIDGRAVVKIPE
jgi:propanol-preferring alcohol dehydrogenase